jgi:hypothetical protein
MNAPCEIRLVGRRNIAIPDAIEQDAGGLRPHIIIRSVRTAMIGPVEIVDEIRTDWGAKGRGDQTVASRQKQTY